MRSITRHLVPLAVLAAFATAACSGSSPGPSTTSTAAASTTSTTTASPTAGVTSTAPPLTSEFPVDVDTDAGSVTIPARPERIAALSSVHVEILFAIGAGEQVIAGDAYSNYPPAAAELPEFDSFNLNVESVIDIDPDLVVLSFDPGAAVAALDAVGIPTLLLGTASSLEAAYAQIEALGLATGHRAEAASVVSAMQTGIQAVVDDLGDAGRGVSFYHEADPFSFYTPNSDSFLGRLYTLLGMVNIADAAPDEFGGGFPQLSPEYIIDSDPDIIFLGSEGESPAMIAQRDGWSSMTAVEEGRIVELDPDIASRWGPRVVDLMRTIGDAVLEFESGEWP